MGVLAALASKFSAYLLSVKSRPIGSSIEQAPASLDSDELGKKGNDSDVSNDREASKVAGDCASRTHLTWLAF